MGFSIGKVFKPIEKEMKKYTEVDALCLPVPNYSPKGLWQNIKTARKVVKDKGYDIVHITGAEHYLIPFLKGQKVVITVHDLGFFTNHKWTLRAWMKYYGWIFTLKFADRITFISEKSMKEAESLVKLKDECLRVVHNAVSPDFTFSSRLLNLNSPVVLHIGTKSNKNLDNTILALKNSKCKLRIIGKLNEVQMTLLQLYNISYSVAENLTDNQIVEEYRNCDIVNFPSFYEGFGMPIIEGQAIGRPVLTSNLVPMNEIAGDAAILVNPADVDSIRQGYDHILQNWSSFVDRGLKNVQRFSVEKIAKEYYQIYKELLNDETRVLAK